MNKFPTVTLLGISVIFIALTNLMQSSRLEDLENKVEKLEESVYVQDNRPPQPVNDSKKK